MLSASLNKTFPSFLFAAPCSVAGVARGAPEGAVDQNVAGDVGLLPGDRANHREWATSIQRSVVG